MTVKSRLKKFITGLNVPQEYCCLDLEKFEQPLSVFLTLRDSEFSLDVTASHLFLGYKPLIIGISLSSNDENYKVLNEQRQVCLSFGEYEVGMNKKWRGFAANRRSVARLLLRRIHLKTHGQRVIILYEGEYGEHSFLSPFHQLLNLQRRRLHKEPSNNVGLPGNLIDQVRIAYSIPRKISIVTVSDGSLINMFPTDLHGPGGEAIYLSSLRIGGKATQQVEEYKKIVVSDVESSFYKQSYRLGGNHMSELREEGQFVLSRDRSEVFSYPMPLAVTKYRELRQIDALDHGIHRVHLYEIVNQKTIGGAASTLAHIHQHYAQWREDQGLITQLFYR